MKMVNTCEKDLITPYELRHGDTSMRQQIVYDHKGRECILSLELWMHWLSYCFAGIRYFAAVGESEQKGEKARFIAVEPEDYIGLEAVVKVASSTGRKKRFSGMFGREKGGRERTAMLKF